MRDTTPKSRFYTDDFPRRSGRSKYFAYLGTYMLFVEQPVVILSLYDGGNQWLLEPGCDESTTFNRSHLKMYVRNRWSPIHISHGFAFNLHILHNSFSTTRLLIEDVTILIVFNLWKVAKIMQYSLMPVWWIVNSISQQHRCPSVHL